MTTVLNLRLDLGCFCNTFDLSVQWREGLVA